MLLIFSLPLNFPLEPALSGAASLTPARIALPLVLGLALGFNPGAAEYWSHWPAPFWPWLLLTLRGCFGWLLCLRRRAPKKHAQ